ncbi:MAG: NYN domain-containing protein [Candidatus Brocadiaceae bacterium]|nr:NYN domain-containing protein [Candidatus Brocadiaceae bacterium]
MVIIIDGYNLIYSVPELEKYVEVHRIESVRNHVVSLLSKYQEEKPHTITIVFDGTYSDTVLPRKQIFSGITVIYSKTGVNADTAIKNIVNLCQNPNDVYVVTYDNDIKRHVKKRGCHIINPKTLYKEILGLLNKNGTRIPSDEPRGKLDGPSEKDARYWIEVFKNVPIPKEEKKSLLKNVTLKIKKRGNLSWQKDTLLCKQQGSSAEDTEYWVKIFEGIEKDEE